MYPNAVLAARANQHLIVKYEPMSANAICSTVVGGVLMVPLYF